MTSEFLRYGIGVLLLWLIAMRLRSGTARQVLYLIASWLFYYSWGGWLIVILIFSSLMNYVARSEERTIGSKGSAIFDSGAEMTRCAHENARSGSQPESGMIRVSGWLTRGSKAASVAAHSRLTTTVLHPEARSMRRVRSRGNLGLRGT